MWGGTNVGFSLSTRRCLLYEQHVPQSGLNDMDIGKQLWASGDHSYLGKRDTKDFVLNISTAIYIMATPLLKIDRRWWPDILELDFMMSLSLAINKQS
jgi:hypothetical protein